MRKDLVLCALETMNIQVKQAWAKFNLGQLVKVQAQELRTPNQWGIAHI